MNITAQERETLRGLATRYMQYALSEKNNENRRLWYALNHMHMEKPMITINQMPWHELDVDGSLVCTVSNPYFREVETKLRQEIYKWEHLPTDMVLNPYIILPRPVEGYDFGIQTQNKEQAANGTAESHLFEDQLEEFEDIEKIKVPQLRLNLDKEAEIFAIGHDIFDGIAPIKMGGIRVRSGLWDQISFWKGVENCYIDLIDRPELIHAIMDHLINVHLALIEQINKLGVYDIVSNVCHCSYTFNNQLPSKTCDENHPTTYDGWTYSMAQLFTSVSPEVNKEFEVPYMKKLFSCYGAV